MTVKESAVTQCLAAIALIEKHMQEADTAGNQVYWLAMQAAHQRALGEMQFWSTVQP